MKECPYCNTVISEENNPESHSGIEFCPHCKASLPQNLTGDGDAESRVPHPIRNYFQTLKQILFHPVLFFQKIPPQGNLAEPLIFALVTHWIGSALGYWADLGFSTQRGISSWKKLFQFSQDFDIDQFGQDQQLTDLQSKMSEWLTGVGHVLLDPFFSLFSLFIGALFIYAGARLLVSPGKDGQLEEISFESALRIVCFSAAPLFFGFVPFFGPLFSHLFSSLLCIIGAREVYRISLGRALIVALFSKIIFFGILLFGFFSFAFFLIKLLTF